MAMCFDSSELSIRVPLGELAVKRMGQFADLAAFKYMS